MLVNFLTVTGVSGSRCEANVDLGPNASHVVLILRDDEVVSCITVVYI